MSFFNFGAAADAALDSLFSKTKSDVAAAAVEAKRKRAQAQTLEKAPKKHKTVDSENKVDNFSDNLSDEIEDDSDNDADARKLKKK
ncbi:UNVERIFIED_CONTAM: hypothetical protein HDU68_006937, partial [Siphonaria sp. JEL0065]